MFRKKSTIKIITCLVVIIIAGIGYWLSEKNKDSDKNGTIANKSQSITNNNFYNAYGDGKSHILQKTFSTKREALKKYSFLTTYLKNNPQINWQYLEVDFCAIQQALEDGKETIPKGEYLINQPLEHTDMYLKGVGRKQTKIIQKDLSKPIIIANGVPYIADLYIGHVGIPDIKEHVPYGTGIYIDKGLDDGSVIERLNIQNVTSGIFLKKDKDVHVYSSSIRDVRIARFRHSAIYFGGQGHTGNVISNIYAVNWDDYNKKTKLAAPYGFVFKGFNEGTYSQLNVEHGKYGKGIVVADSNLDLVSTHFEGYEANEDYGALFHIGGDSTVNVRNASIVYSAFKQNNVKSYAVLAIGGNSNVNINSFESKENGVEGTPTLRKFYGANTIKENASIFATQFYLKDNVFKSNDYFPINPPVPVVRQLNEERYFWIENKTRNFIKSELPTSGYYQKGDIVHIYNASTHSSEKWLRVSTGNSNKMNQDWKKIEN